jgi:hypothetical protein
MVKRHLPPEQLLDPPVVIRAPFSVPDIVTLKTTKNWSKVNTFEKAEALFWQFG